MLLEVKWMNYNNGFASNMIFFMLTLQKVGKKRSLCWILQSKHRMKRKGRRRRAARNMRAALKARNQPPLEALLWYLSGVSVIWETRVSSMQSCRYSVWVGNATHENHKLFVWVKKGCLFFFVSLSEFITDTVFAGGAEADYRWEEQLHHHSCTVIWAGTKADPHYVPLWHILYVKFHLTGRFRIMFSGSSSDPAGKAWIAHSGYVSANEWNPGDQERCCDS